MAHNEGLGANWKPRRAFWADRASNESKSQALIEVIEPHKVWLHGKVVDGATGRPTAVRMAFRSPQGRYIPPYGHRSEINKGWFQDYGGDVKLMDASFA